MSTLKLLFVCLAWASLAQADMMQDFATLFANLGSADFQVRESAQTTLTRQLMGGLLTSAEIQTIQGGISNTDLEVARRCIEIFEPFVATLPSYQTIVSAAGTQGKLGNEVQFDGATGLIAGPSGGKAANVLLNGWTPVEQALAVGNSANLNTALMNLRNAVANNLTDGNVRDLSLALPNGTELTRQDVLNQIDKAIQASLQFPLDLQLKGAIFDAIPLQPSPIQNAGAYPMNDALALTVATLANPGGLAVFDSIQQFATSLPPPGYSFVGDIFELSAANGLVVSGNVQVSLSFLDSIFVTGSPDPGSLQIVRFANGSVEFLPSSVTGTDTLTGTYAADLFSTGVDQFGEFALVQAVPEPATWVLTGSLLSLFGARRVTSRAGRR